MDYTRDVIEDGEDHIDPELGAQPHLEKDFERREDDEGVAEAAHELTVEAEKAAEQRAE